MTATGSSWISTWIRARAATAPTTVTRQVTACTSITWAITAPWLASAQDFPEVVLENCSSGGLRIDLGILRQTHMTFLSDPDWPVHDLQIFWGASTMLAPDVLLHWSFCDWRSTNPPPQQTFNPRDPEPHPETARLLHPHFDARHVRFLAEIARPAGMGGAALEGTH